MRHLRTLFAAWVLAPSVLVQGAELKLAALFSEHMVLQRDRPVPVWGWADPGEKITVEFAGQKKTATAGAGGRWEAKLDAMAASAEPRTLTAASETGGRTVQVRDVLVGEVWLGSGQSNMAMSMGGVINAAAEKAAANWPLIRMFKEESAASATPGADARGRWQVCSPETVTGFSATLFCFGREIHRELKVPVGLINSSVGGTPIEAWTSADAQAAVPELKEALAQEARKAAAFDAAKARGNYEKALASWKDSAAQAKAAGKPAPRKPRDPAEAQTRRGGPGGLFNGKIAPLIPCAMRGAVWYQGEANSHPGKGGLYRHQFPALVSDWRARWGEEFPFAWVQLPNFNREGDDWSLVREAMLKTLRLPKTGMAITVDIGEPQNIHPKNKQEVGRRLALWALGDVYGRDVAATSGPLPAGHEVRGAGIVVAFTHADGGLQAKGGGELRGFALAGADRQWTPAQARIEGDKVFVSSAAVKRPVAVRYAWAAHPECNLYSGAGLPASPFRTDDWEFPEAGAARSGEAR
jgi:sialate O-acetylesterase